jgi:hypothetical protein
MAGKRDRHDGAGRTRMHSTAADIAKHAPSGVSSVYSMTPPR